MGPILQKLKTTTASLFRMQKQLVHCACISVKHKQSCSKLPAPSIWCDYFEQKGNFVVRKNLFEFLTRAVTIFDNQTDVSAWEKVTFDQSFISKHQIFSFENCPLV